MHTPYSYDACDKDGIVDGVVNEDCLADIRTALCRNRVDYVFMTDHPDQMASYSMQELLLYRAGDELQLSGSDPIANRLQACAEGVRPTLSVGFESRLMALGMTKHLAGDAAQRKTAYESEDVTVRNSLATDVDALVFIPHTESRTNETIQGLSPDGIEIYNTHANLDPKIRYRDLHAPPFQKIGSLLTYVVDPYSDLNPDFSFMQFLDIYPIYAQKWNQLTATGMHLSGILATDSHQNISKLKVADGERLDSHRRMMRLMSNHVLVQNNSYSYSDVKQAVKNGRLWGVFEGLGSPVGMDFYATAGATVAGSGETFSLGGGTALITVKLPALHPASPRDHLGIPQFRVVVKKAVADGSDKVVAQSINSDLSVTVSETGVYRAEIFMIPRHLKGLIGPFGRDADREFAWIITNPVYVTN